MNTEVDDKIISMFHADKDRAFSLLLDEYHDRLYWHIRSIVLTHEDANDVNQECMIKVFKNLHKFKGDSSLYTWIYRIATNQALDFLRKKKRKRTESIDMHMQEIRRRASDAFIDPSKIEEKLIQALDELPEKQKLVFQMRYFGKRSYEEIAKITGTSIGGLKANYHHAVKKITDFIKNNPER